MVGRKNEKKREVTVRQKTQPHRHSERLSKSRFASVDLHHISPAVAFALWTHPTNTRAFAPKHDRDENIH